MMGDTMAGFADQVMAALERIRDKLKDDPDAMRDLTLMMVYIRIKDLGWPKVEEGED
jgi:hypothetical protein